MVHPWQMMLEILLYHDREDAFTRERGLSQTSPKESFIVQSVGFLFHYFFKMGNMTVMSDFSLLPCKSLVEKSNVTVSSHATTNHAKTCHIMCS